MGSHALLQGIFPTQGSKPGSPALQMDSLPAELLWKPLSFTKGKFLKKYIKAL